MNASGTNLIKIAACACRICNSCDTFSGEQTWRRAVELLCRIMQILVNFDRQIGGIYTRLLIWFCHRKSTQKNVIINVFLSIAFHFPLVPSFHKFHTGQKAITSNNFPYKNKAFPTNQDPSSLPCTVVSHHSSQFPAVPRACLTFRARVLTHTRVPVLLVLMFCFCLIFMM